MSEDNTLLAKICTRTTCHGPLDFYQAKGWGRLFWGLVTFGAFLAIGYYTYQIIVQYLMKQTATSITVINTDRMLFPNITICNAARYNASYIMDQVDTVPYVPDRSDQFKREYVRYLRVLSGSAEEYNEKNDRELVRNLETVYQEMFNTSIIPNARNVSSFLKEATFHCDQYLIECTFDQKPFNCCDFVRMPFTDYAYCYTIDIRSNETVDGYQMTKGDRFGLDITIQMDMNNIFLISQLEEVGIRVHVVDYATPMDFNPIAVPTSMHAHILLDAVHYSLNSDADQCLTNGKQLGTYETYTKTLCHLKCLDDTIWEMCACEVMASYTERDNKFICTPLQMIQCVFPRLVGMTTDSNVYMEKFLNCSSKQCPKMCDYWSYSSYAMYTKIDSHTINTTTKQTNTTTIRLSVYFADLSYEEYQEQILIDFPTFVSNLGGILGLWTGISILTLIQFLVIVFFGSCEDRSGICGCGKKRK